MPGNKRLGPIVVVAAVIEKEGRYLITQRRSSAVLPFLWEFPGGKVEAEENDTAALKREVRHRLGVEIEVNEQISLVNHEYEKYSVELHLYGCILTEGDPTPLNVQGFRWVLSREFDSIPFTPADERSMSQLLGLN